MKKSQNPSDSFFHQPSPMRKPPRFNQNRGMGGMKGARRPGNRGK